MARVNRLDVAGTLFIKRTRNSSSNAPNSDTNNCPINPDGKNSEHSENPAADKGTDEFRRANPPARRILCRA